jgi:hypothetical protein
MWFKKENSAVIKSLELEKIQSISIQSTPRPLAYSTVSFSLSIKAEVVASQQNYVLGI